jgi:hypothetical protein
MNTFTKSLVLKAFKAAGIYPPNAHRTPIF